MLDLQIALIILLMSISLNNIFNGLKAGTFKNIVVLTGAGISTGAGIPDFRSPGGMYDTLQPELITASRKQRKAMTRDPTEVICYHLFQENQFPYLEVRRPFIMGTAEQKWKATLSHFFLKVLHEKGLLKRVYTQNIDGLDFQLGLPAEKLVHVHGTIGEASCEFCSAPYPAFREAVRTNIKNIYDPQDPQAPKESTHILCHSCHRPGVKPDTVMYGRDLPEIFFQYCDMDFPPVPSPPSKGGTVQSADTSTTATETETEADEVADLLLVVGTSLTVSPANSLVHLVPDACPRVVVNTVAVGEDMGLQYVHVQPPCSGTHASSATSAAPSSVSGGRDHLLAGRCDEVFLDLCVQLGWEEDLFQHFDAMSAQGQELISAHRNRMVKVKEEEEEEHEEHRAGLKRKIAMSGEQEDDVSIALCEEDAEKKKLK